MSHLVLKIAKVLPKDAKHLIIFLHFHRYVGFCMKFVNMLLSHGIKPILVFDGCTLPSKKEVEKSRRE